MTTRSLLYGVLFASLTSFIVTWAELVTASIQIGFLQLPPVVIGLLFLLLLLNKSLIKFKKALSPQELAVIFCMMLVSAMISSRGLMEDLPSTLTGINYYANEVNKWKEIFFANVKKPPVSHLPLLAYQNLYPLCWWNETFYENSPLFPRLDIWGIHYGCLTNPLCLPH